MSACVTIAAAMLDVAPEFLPLDLRKRLERANQLAKVVGGEIVSRQVVATIICQWECDTGRLSQ